MWHTKVQPPEHTLLASLGTRNGCIWRTHSHAGYNSTSTTHTKNSPESMEYCKNPQLPIFLTLTNFNYEVLAPVMRATSELLGKEKVLVGLEQRQSRYTVLVIQMSFPPPH